MQEQNLPARASHRMEAMTATLWEGTVGPTRTYMSLLRVPKYRHVVNDNVQCTVYRDNELRFVLFSHKIPLRSKFLRQTRVRVRVAPCFIHADPRCDGSWLPTPHRSIDPHGRRRGSWEGSSITLVGFHQAPLARTSITQSALPSRRLGGFALTLIQRPRISDLCVHEYAIDICYRLIRQSKPPMRGSGG